MPKIRFLTSAVDSNLFEYRRGEVHDVGERFATEMLAAGHAEPVEEPAGGADDVPF